MAEICPVCKEEVGSNDHFSAEGAEGDVEVHTYCLDEFHHHPEKYDGKATEPQIKAEKEHQEQKIEDKSVYVKGFSMPFEEMVAFIFKWTMASIPTAIFLAILFLIFTAIIS